MPKRIVSLVGLLVTLIACPGATADTWHPIQAKAIDHQTSLLWRAGPVSRGRLVLYVHGAGETANSTFTDALKQPLIQALHSHGFAVASADAGGTAWGDAPSVRDYLDTLKWTRSLGFKRIYILCQSMGGLDALQLLGQIHVKAWAGIYPLTNLGSIASSSWPGIEQTLGTGFMHYWTTLSPVRVAFPKGLPMMFWSSYGDTVVPRVDNTNVTAWVARNEGARVTVVNTTGNHGDVSNFRPHQLLAFFSAN